MNWLPISTSTRTAPEFIGAEPVQRATWICLMLYCAEHETGGVIRDCASWGDRRWMQTIGCTKAEILVECDLFRFDGQDLKLWGYDPRYEDVIRAKRRGGHIGGKLSGKARLKHSNEGVLEGVLERRGVEGRGEERIKPVQIQTGKISDQGDKYERIRSISQDKLAEWAAKYCEDAPEWIRVYNSYIGKLGPEGFRGILEQFVAEVDSGEDGRKRGAVLVAKLKEAIAVKRNPTGQAADHKNGG